jgi:hypothetical protein
VAHLLFVPAEARQDGGVNVEPAAIRLTTAAFAMNAWSPAVPVVANVNVPAAPKSIR